MQYVSFKVAEVKLTIISCSNKTIKIIKSAIIGRRQLLTQCLWHGKFYVDENLTLRKILYA